MKNIKQVSLNSIVFYVEEDGYIVLKQYIDKLERYYADKENGNEIVEDIQIRFAELLSEKRTFAEQAITLQNIEDVIDVLGYPDNFEPNENKESKQQESPSNKKQKRLYRDLDNAKIGGVCSGLAYYLGTDAWVFRLIFIFLGLFSAGTWILVYFVLWFIIPMAKTTQQRYEMKGEALNIEDIEQKIKSGIHEAETNVRNFATKNADKFRQTANELSSSAKNIFQVIGKILGICLIFISVCAIAVILLVWFVPFPSFFKVEPEFSVFCIRDMFTFFGLNGIAAILCLMCILLPLVMFLLIGISLLISKMGRKMGVIILCIFIVWIAISVFFGIGMAMFVVKETTNNTVIEETLKFSSDYQTVVIKSNFDKVSSLTKIGFFNGSNLYIQSEAGQNQVYGITNLNNIVYTNDSTITVHIFQENCKDTIMREFQGSITMEDSVLYIPYLFPLRKNYWSREEISVQLFIPSGKKVIIEDCVWKNKFYTDTAGFIQCEDLE